MTLFGALVVGGMLLLERVTEPAPQRNARERSTRDQKPGTGMPPIARAPGTLAGGAPGFEGSLRDKPAGFFISLN
ncbi:MAG: hypothetical protein ACOC9Z_03375 [Chloroflexota bacterium]